MNKGRLKVYQKYLKLRIKENKLDLSREFELF